MSKKKPKPSLLITFVNIIDIPPNPKPRLSLSKIVHIEFPPVPESSSNENNEELKKENEHKCNYCYFEHLSFEQMKSHRKTVHNEDFSLI